MTVTTPGNARTVITTGGYNALTGARYLESGRGPSGTGQVKPAFCAPGVEVQGVKVLPFGSGRQEKVLYESRTGTSISAAITAGAAAQTLEWGILKGNAPSMNSVEVCNFLIRGCQREDNQEYPNTAWGYGRLNIYQSFLVLRK